jgi:hypothetical protein
MFPEKGYKDSKKGLVQKNISIKTEYYYNLFRKQPEIKGKWTEKILIRFHAIFYNNHEFLKYDPDT